MGKEAFKRQLDAVLSHVSDISDSIFTEDFSKVEISIEFEQGCTPTVTVNRKMTPMSVLRSAYVPQR